MEKIKKIVTLALATGFGLGLSPVASGTVGSLWGVLIVYLFSVFGLSVLIQAVICLILIGLAVPICGLAEKYLGTKDDGRIVADEYMTFPICMLGLPFSPWVVAMAFVVCRGFDIIKLPPARQFDRDVGGGVGIVFDDVAASVYALALNHLLYFLVTRFFLH